MAQDGIERLEQDATRMRLYGGPWLARLLREQLSNATTHGPHVSGVESELEILRGRLNAQALAGGYAALARRDAAEGRIDSARSTLEVLAADGWKNIPETLGYLNALCQCGMLAIALRDRARAQSVYELLTPYDHFETPTMLAISGGPVAYYLAALAVFLELPEASSHFELTISLCEERGLRPQLAAAWLDLASWSKRACPKRATQASTRASELAEELGMQWLVDRARALP